MSIRYPVMVFSFENVPAKRGEGIGFVSIHEKEVALSSIHDFVEGRYGVISDLVGSLHGDVYGKLARNYLEQFLAESQPFRKSVHLSSQTVWSLHVAVVNSDVEFIEYMDSVSCPLREHFSDIPLPRELVDTDDNLQPSGDFDISDFWDPSHESASFKKVCRLLGG